MKRYIKDGVIKSAIQIIVKHDKAYIVFPSEELILADGWVEYVPPTIDPTERKKSPMAIVEELVTDQNLNGCVIKQVPEPDSVVYKDDVIVLTIGRIE